MARTKKISNARKSDKSGKSKTSKTSKTSKPVVKPKKDDTEDMFVLLNRMFDEKNIDMSFTKSDGENANKKVVMTVFHAFLKKIKVDAKPKRKKVLKSHLNQILVSMISQSREDAVYKETKRISRVENCNINRVKVKAIPDPTVELVDKDTNGDLLYQDEEGNSISLYQIYSVDRQGKYTEKDEKPNSMRMGSTIWNGLQGVDTMLGTSYAKGDGFFEKLVNDYNGYRYSLKEEVHTNEDCKTHFRDQFKEEYKRLVDELPWVDYCYYFQATVEPEPEPESDEEDEEEDVEEAEETDVEEADVEEAEEAEEEIVEPDDEVVIDGEYIDDSEPTPEERTPTPQKKKQKRKPRKHHTKH